MFCNVQNAMHLCKEKKHFLNISVQNLATHEFDWIVFPPGLLHLEMNAGRAFIKLLWSVFMESSVYGNLVSLSK